MVSKVYVVGVGMSKFVKPCSGIDYPEFALEATVKALNDAGISYDDVQFAVVGYVFGDSTSGQRVLYQLGMTQIPIVNVSNNCSSGSAALFQARNTVASGMADCALALGFDRMARGPLAFKFNDRTNPLDHVIATITKEIGYKGKAPLAAQISGNAGIAYMEQYGACDDHFAKIAEKNHRHSARNPYSQFRDVYTLEQIKNSPQIYGLLTRLQCCPNSDGASCVVVASEAFVQRHDLMDQAVEICAQAMATDSQLMLTTCAIEWPGTDMTRRAASQAYAMAGVTPNDIQVIELHDAFSVNELITYDALGLVLQGKAHTLVDNGDNTYGGKYVVNPSGGLIAKGNPLGATGLAQCTELVWQLRNWAGDRQVPNCKYALQHNLGLGGAVVVSIYKKANANPCKPRASYNPAVEARHITKEEFEKAASKKQNRAALFESKL